MSRSTVRVRGRPKRGYGREYHVGQFSDREQRMVLVRIFQIPDHSIDSCKPLSKGEILRWMTEKYIALPG